MHAIIMKEKSYFFYFQKGNVQYSTMHNDSELNNLTEYNTQNAVLPNNFKNIIKI